MERNWDMDQVSDGKRYRASDMVKLGCQDCAGCWACCQDMGKSVVLDPYDIYCLSKELGWDFQQLLEQCLELNVVDGVILPNLRMTADKNQCFFLNEEGRCQIHKARPGICRLFPLGRIYEEGSFRYFLQVKECHKTNRSKVKISKWLDIPQLQQYEGFVVQWHYFLKELQEKMAQRGEEKWIREMNMLVLNQFFVNPYDVAKDFYDQFHCRMDIISK